MRDDLQVGNPFPDLRLPDTTNRAVSLSEIAEHQPLLLCFVRGWWCPKEQVRLANLVAMQEEITREYGRIVVVTVDGWYGNGALRAGLGASFPFLGDPDREVATELDLVERTDARHDPFAPVTFMLDSAMTITRVWIGY
jgi:peroxiredoxin